MPHFPELVATAQHMSAGVFGKTTGRAAAQPPDRVFSLHVGDTYLEPLPAARAEAQSSAQLPRLHNYSPTQGEPRLISAIASKLQKRSGVVVEPERIQVMPGATAAMGIICNTLIDASDEVIIPSPFWPLIRGAVRARGARAVEVPLFTRLDEPGFDPVAAIEAAITPRTVAIYINAPNNPTGRVLSDQALAQIAALAERHALWIISDEAYEDIWFGSSAPASVFARPDFAPRTVATHSVSKAYALAGARVGYTHGPRALMDTIRGVQTFYSYCAPTPMQFAAACAIEQGETWLNEMRATYGSAGRAAARALEQRAPEGGTFLFFDMQPFSKRSEQVSDVLDRCAEAGVMLTPGTACGTDFPSWARLCFTTVPEPDLHEALERLRAVLFA
jgi:N-succinyldiaminopimelate aminotransferase